MNGSPFGGAILAPGAGVFGDADAQDYFARVAAAGGTLSDTVKDAVTAYVLGLKAADVWGNIGRLGLFLGGFASAFVPLKNTIGNAADTNVGFISANYNELGASAGLKGNSLNKYIQTGVASTAVGQNDRHVGCYVSIPELGVTRVAIGENSAGSTEIAFSGAGLLAGRASSPTSVVSNVASSGFEGFALCSRLTAIEIKLYLEAATFTGAVTSAAIGASTFYVFSRDTGALPSLAGLSMYTIGSGVTPVKAASYRSLTLTLWAAIGR